MIIREIRRRAKKLITPAIVLCVAVYLSFHLLHGSKGARAQWRLQEDVVAAQSKLDKLKQERDKLELKVKLLRPDSVCPDLLDEQARRVLGYANPNDVIILRKSKND